MLYCSHRTSREELTASRGRARVASRDRTQRREACFTLDVSCSAQTAAHQQRIPCVRCQARPVWFCLSSKAGLPLPCIMPCCSASGSAGVWTQMERPHADQIRINRHHSPRWSSKSTHQIQVSFLSTPLIELSFANRLLPLIYVFYGMRKVAQN